MRCTKCGIIHTRTSELCSSCTPDLQKQTQETKHKKTCNYAIAGFILGIFSFIDVCSLGICSVLFGIIAIVIICKNEQELKGKKLALAGIMLPFFYIMIFNVFFNVVISIL